MHSKSQKNLTYREGEVFKMPHVEGGLTFEIRSNRGVSRVGVGGGGSGVLLLKSENKMQYLYQSLQTMNKNLPATCYLPILNKYQRNYMILNIVEKESRLFITAEKAPFLICIEVF